MAVLVEASSVVIRVDALMAAFGGSLEAFKRTVPNATLCTDGELVRVGFMAPADVEAYVNTLGRHGLTYLRGGAAVDLVCVDQLRGPVVPCTWVEFGHVNLDNDHDKRVAACRLNGSSQNLLHTPDAWTYEDSLSQNVGFVPTEAILKDLIFLRHEGGKDVYRHNVTGKEVYVGRTAGTKRT